MQSSPALLPLFYDNDIRSYLTIWLKFISDRHMLHNATSNQIKSFLELEFPYQPLFVYLLKWTLGWQLTLTDLIPLILNLWRAILPLLLPPPGFREALIKCINETGRGNPPFPTYDKVVKPSPPTSCFPGGIDGFLSFITILIRRHHDINMQWEVQLHRNLAMNPDHDSGCLFCSPYWPRRRKAKKVQDEAAKSLVCIRCRILWINHRLNLPSHFQKLIANKSPRLCQRKRNMHSKQRKGLLTYWRVPLVWWEFLSSKMCWTWVLQW